jgi:hypothetical protein
LQNLIKIYFIFQKCFDSLLIERIEPKEIEGPRGAPHINFDNLDIYLNQDHQFYTFIAKFAQIALTVKHQIVRLDLSTENSKAEEQKKLNDLYETIKFHCLFRINNMFLIFSKNSKYSQ